MTQATADMIAMLKSLGIDKTTTLGIVNFLDSPEKMKAMVKYILKEHDAGKRPTEQQILRQLKEILRQYGGLNEGVK